VIDTVAGLVEVSLGTGAASSLVDRNYEDAPLPAKAMVSHGASDMEAAGIVVEVVP